MTSGEATVRCCGGTSSASEFLEKHTDVPLTFVASDFAVPPAYNFEPTPGGGEFLRWTRAALIVHQVWAAGLELEVCELAFRELRSGGASTAAAAVAQAEALAEKAFRKALPRTG